MLIAPAMRRRMLTTREQCMARAVGMFPKITLLKRIRIGVAVTAHPVSAAPVECIRWGTRVDRMGCAPWGTWADLVAWAQWATEVVTVDRSEALRYRAKS